MVKGVKKELVVDKKVNDLENKLKRVLADYDNLEKRIEREKREFILFSSAHLLRRVLAILDDLERCEEHLKDQGLSLVYKKFKDFLDEEGVEEIKVEGEEFNPELMEAVEMVEGPKDKVVEVIAKGYRFNEKVLLRPVKVKVGGGKRAESQ